MNFPIMYSKEDHFSFANLNVDLTRNLKKDILELHTCLENSTNKCIPLPSEIWKTGINDGKQITEFISWILSLTKTLDFYPTKSSIDDLQIGDLVMFKEPLNCDLYGVYKEDVKAKWQNFDGGCEMVIETIPYPGSIIKGGSLDIVVVDEFFDLGQDIQVGERVRVNNYSSYLAAAKNIKKSKIEKQTKESNWKEFNFYFADSTGFNEGAYTKKYVYDANEFMFLEVSCKDIVRLSRIKDMGDNIVPIYNLVRELIRPYQKVIKHIFETNKLAEKYGRKRLIGKDVENIMGYFLEI